MRRTRRRRWVLGGRRYGRLVTVVVFILFGALWLYAIFFQIRPWEAGARRERLNQVVADGPRAMADLGAPPDADTLGPLETTSSTRRGPVATFVQEFTRPGTFADTVAWYQAQLGARGWEPFDPASWRDFRADLCSPPWLLEIERAASFEEDASPSHRFRLRLRWSEDFTDDRCPYPGDSLFPG